MNAIARSAHASMIKAAWVSTPEEAFFFEVGFSVMAMYVSGQASWLVAVARAI